MSRRYHLLLVAVMAFLALAQAWTSMRGKSMTFDELVYIPAGVSYVATGDYRLNPEHPPLAKVLAGLALLAEHVRFDTSDPAWQSADQWAVGQHFFNALGPETPRIVTVARFPSVLLTMLLVVIAYAMGRALYGVEAGLLAAWFCAFSPNLLRARAARDDRDRIDLLRACDVTGGTPHDRAAFG